MFIENIEMEWGREKIPKELQACINELKNGGTSAIAKLHNLADRGSVLAMTYLGDAYENGRSVGRDFETGQAWYKLAAKNGSIEASHRLAYMYFQAGNYLKSMEEIEKLCDRGFTPAMYCLGSFYSIGTGVEKSELAAGSVPLANVQQSVRTALSEQIAPCPIAVLTHR